MNDFDYFETKEAMEKMKQSEHQELIDALLEKDVLTIKGRVIKSKLAKELGWKVSYLEKQLEGLKELALVLMGIEDQEEDENFD